MKWSIRLGQVAGVTVYVHLTFLLLLTWIVIGHFMAERDLSRALQEGAFIVTVFGIIVAHELGHALAARRYGIQTRDITLLPIGGIARLARIPEDPRQELVIALAGPAVNVVMALGLFIGFATSQQLRLADASMMQGSLLQRLFWINVILAGFNLLPAFPMDGGRALRALLAMRMDYLRATRIAANIGQAMALAFGLIGLLVNPFLAFVALFVWIGAAQEAGMAFARSVLHGESVGHAMVREFHTLETTDTLAVAVQHVVAGSQHDFPVVEDGRLVGVLVHSDLLRALAQGGPTTCVADVMCRDFQTAESSELLEDALSRLEQSDCPALPVLDHSKPVGLLTPALVGEFVMIQDAIRSGPEFARRNWPAAGSSGTGDGRKIE